MPRDELTGRESPEATRLASGKQIMRRGSVPLLRLAYAAACLGCLPSFDFNASCRSIGADQVATTPYCDEINAILRDKCDGGPSSPDGGSLPIWYSGGAWSCDGFSAAVCHEGNELICERGIADCVAGFQAAASCYEALNTTCHLQCVAAPLL
jgi:hypothetical protein